MIPLYHKGAFATAGSFVIAALRSRCGQYIFILWFVPSFFFLSIFFLLA